MSVEASTPQAPRVLFKTLALVGLSLQLLAIASCGGSKGAAAPPNLDAVGPPEQQLAAPPIENVQAPITHVERADVDAAIEAGVGRFIQGFDMVEELDEYDRFVGWKIGKIYDRARFEGLGIGSGDVITSINGLPLERPVHAYEALMSLKTAKSIDIEYLRGGRVMRLSLPILNESAQQGSPAAGDASSKKGPTSSEPKVAPRSAESSGERGEKKKPDE